MPTKTDIKAIVRCRVGLIYRRKDESRNYFHVCRPLEAWLGELEYNLGSSGLGSGRLRDCELSELSGSRKVGPLACRVWRAPSPRRPRISLPTN